ncbi:uncharacterized protein LOC141524953 [Cotesia typhae]|uniref:uncharacterized protein LOC141524953 n=1 Tax=Cotesia typhae TaxID=2053667 RepID=UPI003D6809BD
MDKKLFILDGLVLMLFVSVVKGVENTECVNNGETCEWYDEHLCCDKNSMCKWIASQNRYKCVERAKLGDPCHNSYDCSLTLYSTCSPAGKCVCKRNNVQVNGTRCVPLLNEFCWKESCAPENSMCIDNKCKCKSGFLAKPNDQCLIILLRLQCENDEDCKFIEFSKCSLNKKCECSKNMIAKSPTFCSLLIGEFCNSNRECGITNSECVNNKCQCKTQYLPYFNNSECQLAYLGMFCEDSVYCENRIKNTICNDNICECNANYFSWEDNSCRSLSDLFCENDDKCLKLNALCIDNICHCKPDTVLMKGKCLPRYLGRTCEKTSDCFNIKYSVCLRNQCICNDGFSLLNQSLCARNLGTICLVDQDCLIKNSHCYHYYCKCRDGYIQGSLTKCLPTELQEFCFDDDDCKLMANARCSSENKCICKINYREINEKSCRPLLDESCSHDNECVVAKSICFENKCQCDSKSSKRLNEQCFHLFLNKSCSLHTDCKDIPHAKCWNFSKCVCETNFVQLQSSKCMPLLGGYCTQHNDCVTKNSICIKNTCQCDLAYTEKLFNKCKPISLGQPCKSDINCKLIRKGTCSQTKICVCKPNTFALDKMTCLPTLNTYCMSDECQIEFSHCHSNRCQCKPGYSEVSAYQCMKTQSLHPCTDVSDCVEHFHFDCSEDKKCVCKVNNIAINNSTCLPNLNGYCWKQDQCVVLNAECIDFRCQCKSGSYSVSTNMCI